MNRNHILFLNTTKQSWPHFSQISYSISKVFCQLQIIQVLESRTILYIQPMMLTKCENAIDLSPRLEK